MDEHQKRSHKQEARGAKVYSGQVNSGSGNGDRKNDVRNDDLSIEFKSTVAKSYSLRLADLVLAYRQALIEGRDSLFGIDFHDVETNRTHRYVVQTEDQYLRMKNECGQNCVECET